MYIRMYLRKYKSYKEEHFGLPREFNSVARKFTRFSPLLRFHWHCSDLMKNSFVLLFINNSHRGRCLTLESAWVLQIRASIWMSFIRTTFYIHNFDHNIAAFNKTLCAQNQKWVRAYLIFLEITILISTWCCKMIQNYQKKTLISVYLYHVKFYVGNFKGTLMRYI